jgi:hypothetical protein
MKESQLRRMERLEALDAAAARNKEAQTRALADISKPIVGSDKLRGQRYRHRSNDWLAERIIKDLSDYWHSEACEFYDEIEQRGLENDDKALLACNDRFYLLTRLLGRDDLDHPWFFMRCRQVEANPDGYIDLWARAHGKTSIISIGGTIQEILCDPEITIAIFSATKPLAEAILGQIKNEFETNDALKETFKDVLYENPRGTGPDGRPTKWSLTRGITVKRKEKPKEATVEAHGLIDGQPRGRHFKLHVYDDIVTQDFVGEDQLKKTAERYELADNLGTRHGVRKQIVGTRYHFADVYGAILEKGSAKPRIHPATEDGTLNGTPVLLTPEDWERRKRDQGIKVLSAQMLLNPIAAGVATFETKWFTSYDVIPSPLNVYMLVDPSKGKGQRSDRTAIAVIGIDQSGIKYFLDGYCHRMTLSERWERMKELKRKWENHRGVQMVRVGYEQYGMVDDIGVMEELMLRERNRFEIIELRTPETGGHSKRDRIERLEPEFRGGRFRFPILVHNPGGGSSFWSVWTEERRAQQTAKKRIQRGYHIGEIIYEPAKSSTRRMLEMERSGQRHRIVAPITRRDENGDPYDLVRMVLDELRHHPYGAHDDLIDAASRIYDIKPSAPEVYAPGSTEGVCEDWGPDDEGGPHDPRCWGW